METFQRARRPEQQELRRQAILDAARELLLELPAADISLREIARTLGGSKSGIVTYFETREAVFLALLERERDEWFATFEESLGTGELTDVWARSLAERPVLCALWSQLASVLEHNLSVDSIREFKLRNRDQQRRQAKLVANHVPGLTDDGAEELVNTSIVVLIGLWPFGNPAPAVVEATADDRLKSARVDFVPWYSRTLQVVIAGLLSAPR